MPMFDIEKFVEGLHDYISRAVAPLAVRLERISQEVRALADRQPQKGEPGEPGKPGNSVTAEDVLPELKAHVEALARELPVPKDGKSVTIDEIEPLVERRHAQWALDFERRAQDLLQRAVDRMPVARDGKDGINGKDSDPDVVAARVIERLDLKGTRTDMKRLCGELVAAAVAEIPTPKDGRDGKDGKDATPVTDSQIMAAVEKHLAANPPRNGIDGKDGVSVTPEQVDELVEKRVAARAAEWALDFEKRAQGVLEKAVDRIPRPKDGTDGINFDSFEVEMLEDGRTLRFHAAAGERKVEKTVRLDHVIDRGVHDEKSDYLKGDGVTWSGSFWIAQQDKPKGRPGQFNKHWRLAVKKGRDGASK